MAGWGGLPPVRSGSLFWGCFSCPVVPLFSPVAFAAPRSFAACPVALVLFGSAARPPAGRLPGCCRSDLGQAREIALGPLRGPLFFCAVRQPGSQKDPETKRCKLTARAALPGGPSEAEPRTAGSAPKLAARPGGVALAPLPHSGLKALGGHPAGLPWATSAQGKRGSPAAGLRPSPRPPSLRAVGRRRCPRIAPRRAAASGSGGGPPPPPPPLASSLGRRGQPALCVGPPGGRARRAPAPPTSGGAGLSLAAETGPTASPRRPPGVSVPRPPGRCWRPAALAGGVGAAVRPGVRWPSPLRPAPSLPRGAQGPPGGSVVPGVPPGAARTPGGRAGSGRWGGGASPAPQGGGTSAPLGWLRPRARRLVLFGA